MNKSDRSALVYADLPKAGLGNMLFVWARALVFSHLNNLPYYTSSWTHLRIGPILRRERHTRLYWGYFNSRKVLRPWQRLKLIGLSRIEEPPLEDLPQISDNAVYEFHTIPHWRDYFAGLKPHRLIIREHLMAMISEKTRRRLTGHPKPCIAMHIRMGDFRNLAEGEDFAKVGLVRTPLDYFSHFTLSIRQIAGQELPVTLFSNGSDDELAPLLAIPGVQRAGRNSDIIDLLLMANSQLIICSAGSTFSYWAGFLADAPVLLHPDHIHEPLRPDSVNERYFEGGVREPSDQWPLLLKQNIIELAAFQRK
jgi:hypothetical protein